MQINKLIYMNLKHNFVLVKLNKIEETFILKLKILFLYYYSNINFLLI